MATTVGIIDSLSAPPFGSLRQVLDTGGPYGPGSHTLSTFHTDGAFLLPAGTYQVNGTYGAIVVVNGTIAAKEGFTIGYNDPAAVIQASGDLYESRIAQLCVLRNNMLAPAWIITETFDIHMIFQVCAVELAAGAGMQFGLYVSPNWNVDLYYLCII